MNDRAAIERLLLRYARGIDEKDLGVVGSCFLADARIDYGTFGAYGGWPAIEGALSVLDELKASQHLIVNPLISVDGDRAVAATYLHAQHVLGPDSLFTVGGRYDDELVRVDGAWRFAFRRLSEIWSTGDLPPSIEGSPQEPFGPAFPLPAAVRVTGGVDGSIDAAAPELLSRYAHALDSRDWQALASYFSDDVEVDYGEGRRWTGAEALIAGLSDLTAPLRSTQHLISNVVVQEDGNDPTAVVTSKLIVQHIGGSSEAPEFLTGGGSYRDVLRREADGWRFSKRSYTKAWEQGSLVVLSGQPNASDALHAKNVTPTKEDQ